MYMQITPKFAGSCRHDAPPRFRNSFLNAVTCFFLKITAFIPSATGYAFLPVKIGTFRKFAETLAAAELQYAPPPISVIPESSKVGGGLWLQSLHGILRVPTERRSPSSVPATFCAVCAQPVCAVVGLMPSISKLNLFRFCLIISAMVRLITVPCLSRK